VSDLQRTSLRALDVAQLCARLGGKRPLDPSTLWRRIRRDPDFPRPFYLWDGAPRFVEEEVDAYIARKIAERDDPTSVAAQRERVQRREQKLGEARARARKVKSRTRRSEARPPPPIRSQPREP
jgi:predicted DNA-binding transcriptional regulator AlpA